VFGTRSDRAEAKGKEKKRGNIERRKEGGDNSFSMANEPKDLRG
jgi:hypothetical protein